MKCTSCNNALATVHVLDLENGSVKEVHYLCEACAAAKEPGQKTGPFPKEVLESLLGTGEVDVIDTSATEVACPGCHLTSAEFKMRGRLGCPRCYEVFRSSLLPLLERVHDAVVHQGRFPGRTAKPVELPTNLAELKNRLEHAIAEERYEEAAQLRDELRRADETPETSDGDQGGAS